MKELKDQTAFLTGGASGIGRALALALAAEGCHLCIVDVDETGLLKLKHELSAASVRVWTHVCDLTDRVAVTAAVNAAIQWSGGIDLLINNAGVVYYGATDLMTQQRWDWLMNVNLLAPIQITQQLLPTLLLRRDPHIVNMCSISGLVAGGRLTAYHTSKFGLVGFTESLRAEYGRRGVGVTAICPGPVLTGLYESGVVGQRDKRVPTPPRWMCATPERVAAVTLRAIRKNRRQVLITPTAHLLFQIKRFAPWLIDFLNGFSRHGKKKRLAAVMRSQGGTVAGVSVAGVSVSNQTGESKAA